MSRFQATVSPAVPNRMLDATLEGVLLRSILAGRETDGATRLHADQEGLPSSTVELGSIKAVEYASALATAGKDRPACRAIAEELMRMSSAGETELDLEACVMTAEDGSRSGIDYADLLAGLTLAYPDELPAIEVSYAETDDTMKPDGTGGGAMFITDGKVSQIDARTWLREERAAMAERTSPPGPR